MAHRRLWPIGPRSYMTPEYLRLVGASKAPAIVSGLLQGPLLQSVLTPPTPPAQTPPSDPSGPPAPPAPPAGPPPAGPPPAPAAVVVEPPPAPPIDAGQLLPAPPPVAVVDGMDKRASLLLLKGGPYSVYEPLPWDDHVYPKDLPSLDVAKDLHLRTRRVVAWMAARWREQEGASLPSKGYPLTPRGAPAVLIGEPAPPAPIADDLGELGLDKSLLTSDRVGMARALQDLISKSSQLDLYSSWLKACGIRYFTAPELTRHKWRHTRLVQPGTSGAWAELLLVLGIEPWPAGIWPILPKCLVPEPALWPSILPALRVLDRFRHYLDAPVTAISGYRIPAYNEQIKGSLNSFHMFNCCVDFTYSARNEHGELDAAIFYRFYSSLYKVKGDGVGVYPSFIHFDTGLERHKVGRYTRWYHRDRKSQDTFEKGSKFNLVGDARKKE